MSCPCTETPGGPNELNALDVVREIIEGHRLHDSSFTLFVHPTAPGWRERHRTAEQRIDHSLDDVVDEGWARILLSGRELASSSLDDLDRYQQSEGDLLSICSRLQRPRGGVRHLAMMDLHPEEFIPYDRLTAAVRPLCGEREFWLLRTDRHHHVYGDFTMDEREWLRWNAGFQMPAVLVDAHYVGRSLQLGYNALRLNAGSTYQRVVPATVDADPDLDREPMAARAVRLARLRQSRQLRRSGEPTMHHLREVAELAVAIHADCVKRGVPDLWNVSAEDLYACGYLHDTIEDSATDFEDVEQAAGRQVAFWVRLLSEDKRLPVRERRLAYDDQLRHAPMAVGIVKLADLLSNLRGIRGSESLRWLKGYLNVVDRQLELLAEALDGTAWFCEARDHVGHWRQWLKEPRGGEHVAAVAAEAAPRASSA